ncbi:hypothetical protein QBC47DRAFT_366368 [Echria macrotheca]|uniref:Uncharacterized protein n=1 Tax=Echria macrotheca TaxID=438768 RepID=A0AAJ0BKR4_9PEZI|nr:hypothetical protein QBC47DRAFT_366368 [Echria macrotheca]
MAAAPIIAASATVYNSYNPTCDLTPCLQQVIGQINGDPLAQFASCTDLFGSPTTATVTPSADTLFSTITSTSSYTDIVVSFTTTTSTAEETSTSYDSVFDTTTVFTTTVQQTVTETTQAPTFALVKKSPTQRKKRRGCGRKPSSVSSAWSTTTSTAPLETNLCPNQDVYASACACINAVDHATTVTETPTTVTSTVFETTSSRIESVVSSTVTVIESTVIVQPVTTTATTTINTADASTVTVTTTTTPIGPIQTADLTISGGPRNGASLIVAGGYVQWSSSLPGTKMTLHVDEPSQPYLPDNPSMKLYLRDANTQVGVLGYLTAPSTARDVPVTCSVDKATGIVGCSATPYLATTAFNDFWQCGAYIYMALPAAPASGCIKVTGMIKLKNWIS